MAQLFSTVVRLVPNSTVQFVEIRLSPDRLSGAGLHFIEHRLDDGPGTRTVLMPVDSDALFAGVLLHPITFKPVPADAWLTVSMLDGLEPFVGQWVPLPYHRFSSRDLKGRPMLDHGPLNWVRAFVADPGCDLRDAASIQVILAIDTALGEGDPEDGSRYHAPNSEDVAFGSTFVLRHEASQLDPFLAESWVDGWLRETDASWRQRRGDGKAGTTGGAGTSTAPRFELEYVARYLMLLDILAHSGQMPQFRFIDALTGAGDGVVRPVDLVLDITNQHTVALIATGTGAAGGPALADTRMLRVRELSRPDRVHQQPLWTEVEFDDAPFGSVALSRRSGRASAFAWPSLVRIGQEARRLSLRGTAVPGITGLSGLKSRLTDTRPSDAPWRIGRESAPSGKLGPMVAGEVLTHYRDTVTSAPALRPTFSASNILAHFVAELLLQALSDINAPGRPAGPGPVPVHRIQRIILTTAASMPADERRILVSRVEEAIDAVWRGLGWQSSADDGRPPPPQIALGLDADLGAQLVFLDEEINGKFGGNLDDFIEVVRRPRQSGAPTPVLRIASANIGSQHTNVALVDYRSTRSGAMQPAIVLAERCAIAADAVIDALAERFVLPAIEGELRRLRAPSAASLASAAFGRGAVAGDEDPRLGPHFRRRAWHRIVAPAARALLEVHIAMSASALDGLVEFALADLVASGEGRMDPLDRDLDRVAIADGALQFRLAATRLAVSRRDLAAAVREIMSPLVVLIGQMIHGQECDVLVLSGRLARVPDIETALVELLPAPPRRIVNLVSRQSTLLQMQPRAVDPTAALVGAAGVCLASRDGGEGRFRLFAPPAPVHQLSTAGAGDA